LLRGTPKQDVDDRPRTPDRRILTLTCRTNWEFHGPPDGAPLPEPRDQVRGAKRDPIAPWHGSESRLRRPSAQATEGSPTPGAHIRETGPCTQNAECAPNPRQATGASGGIFLTAQRNA